MNAKLHRSYLDLLRFARRVSKRLDEAEDLLQTVLLTAVEEGRADMSCADNRRWLIGALRKRALFEARSAVRRRNREATATWMGDYRSENAILVTDFARGLPQRLRTTALLALTGHTKAEISWLLNISDTALRQRFVQIKRRWRDAEGGCVAGFPGLTGTLAFGRIRRALLQIARHKDVVLASHDPDGNLFVVTSQNGRPRQRRGTTTSSKE